MNWFRMYRILIMASIRSRMQYRFNFWFSTVMAALVSVIEFMMLAVILMKFGQIHGWTMVDCGYLYAVVTLSKAIYRSMASDVHHLEQYLMTGDLDKLLLKPVPILLALMTQNFSIRVGELIQGIAILAVCMNALMQEGKLTWQAIPLTLVVIVSGAVLLFAIGLVTATMGFWITRVEVLQNITEDAAHTAARYPMSIYPGWLQWLFIGGIPIAFVNYYPTLYIVKQQLSWWIIASSCAVSLLVLGIGLAFWRIGITRYQSTGS